MHAHDEQMEQTGQQTSRGTDGLAWHVLFELCHPSQRDSFRTPHQS